MATILYSRAELKQLHEYFGHPANESLMTLLKRATPANLTSETKLIYDDLVRRCKTCETYVPRS